MGSSAGLQLRPVSLGLQLRPVSLAPCSLPRPLTLSQCQPLACQEYVREQEVVRRQSALFHHRFRAARPVWVRRRSRRCDHHHRQGNGPFSRFRFRGDGEWRRCTGSHPQV